MLRTFRMFYSSMRKFAQQNSRIIEVSHILPPLYEALEKILITKLQREILLLSTTEEVSSRKKFKMN